MRRGGVCVCVWVGGHTEGRGRVASGRQGISDAQSKCAVGKRQREARQRYAIVCCGDVSGLGEGASGGGANWLWEGTVVLGDGIDDETTEARRWQAG